MPTGTTKNGYGNLIDARIPLAAGGVHHVGASVVRSTTLPVLVGNAAIQAPPGFRVCMMPFIDAIYSAPDGIAPVMIVIVPGYSRSGASLVGKCSATVTPSGSIPTEYKPLITNHLVTTATLGAASVPTIAQMAAAFPSTPVPTGTPALVVQMWTHELNGWFPGAPWATFGDKPAGLCTAGAVIYHVHVAYQP